MNAYLFAIVLFVFVAAFVWRVIRDDRRAHGSRKVRL